MSLAIPPTPDEDRQPLRGCVLPYGADSVRGRGHWHPERQLRVEKWADGEEPLLRVKARALHHQHGVCELRDRCRGLRDDRIKGPASSIIEETDPGVFDRARRRGKRVHQLSSTCDPILT